LPLYHPLRLIEEICTLDQLSDGRLELGIGRGVSPYELRYFGVDPDDSRAIFTETLSAMLAGFTHDRLTFEGTHFQCRDMPMAVQPFQKPYPPLWYPTHNPESLAYAARHGFNFVDLGPAAAVRQHVDAYRRTWDAHQHDSGRINGHVATPKLGVVRQVVVADTDEAARTAAVAAHATWFRSITQLWHEHDDHTPDGLFGWETAMQHETILYGSPSRVREQVGRLVQESSCNYVILCFAWGSLPHEQAMHSLQLFTQEIMPAFSGSTS
jgi:alkanesulfonate monooxygenase SsuD/methylene tetrahydromethanopterin reductase-like flavin-dependent oxidoreductase (luciferase family)